MESTPASLIDQLRRRPAGDAWARFVHLFTPVLAGWCRRLGVPPDSQPDLIQDVYVRLLRALPAARYDPDRSFRAWLFAVLANRWKDLARRPAAVSLGPDDPPAPGGDGPGPEDAEDRALLLGRALRAVRPDFTEATWRAFEATAREGRPAEDVARELGLSANAVYLARSRVLRRLRAELDGLLD